MNKGTYLLVLHLPAARIINYGKKAAQFNNGYYVYIGSAFGPGGLESRVSRHLLKKKKLHWHIDYFSLHAEIIAVYAVGADRELEHTYAELLNGDSYFRPAELNFGSSDCSCATHLFFSKRRPGHKIFNQLIAKIDRELSFQVMYPS